MISTNYMHIACFIFIYYLQSVKTEPMRFYPLRMLGAQCCGPSPGLIKKQSDLRDFQRMHSKGLEPTDAEDSLPLDVNEKDNEEERVLACVKLPCNPNEELSPVCACNFNTGNVVTFKNRCDLRKHNCRFDTAFNPILNEICPWEFQSRRLYGQRTFDYSDAKYYN